MKYRTSDGVELFFEQEGQGYPILFLNGMWGDTSTWKSCIPHFSKIFNCLRLDHRGIGKSDKWVGEYSYDLYARDVIELLDHLELDSAHIVGTCHGGMIAATVAKNHPERVGCLVVNGTQLIKTERQSSVYRGWKAILETSGFEVLYRSTIIPAIFSDRFISENKERIDFIVASTAARIKYEAAVKMIEAAVEFGFDQEEISAIQVDALIMSGDEDLFSPPFTIEQVQKLWEKSEYYMFRSCAHFPQRESLDEYIAIVKEYLLRKTLELGRV